MVETRAGVPDDDFAGAEVGRGGTLPVNLAD
jgi:hypothetical protein